MYAALSETAVGLLARYWLLVLLVVFVLEGALVGKLVPTRALVVAAVLTVGGDGGVAVVSAAVVGATVGQVALFGLVRYAEFGSEALPGVADLQERRLGDWFDRWGPSAVAVSNALPVARGSLTVPGGDVGDAARAVLGDLPRRDGGLRLRTARGRRRTRSVANRCVTTSGTATPCVPVAPDRCSDMVSEPVVATAAGLSPIVRRLVPAFPRRTQRTVPCFFEGRCFSTSS